MDRDHFRRLVRRALDDLPPSIAARLSNIAVVIRREPSSDDRTAGHVGPGDDLFGLYVGIPLTARDEYQMATPDRILIFQGPLERHFPPRAIPREVQRTVRHELAHHFGIDDARVEELGRG